MDSDKIPVVSFPDASPYVREAAASTRTEAEVRARRKAIEVLHVILAPGVSATDAVDYLSAFLQLNESEGFGRGLQEAGRVVNEVFLKARAS